MSNENILNPVPLDEEKLDEQATTPIAPLTEDESRELLKQARFARLATLDGDEIDITPINVVSDGEKIYFRSAKGTKILNLQLNPKVTVEIDRVAGTDAFSVVARGEARLITEKDDVDKIEELGLRPWLETEKLEHVEITPTRITGRKFKLGH